MTESARVVIRHCKSRTLVVCHKSGRAKRAELHIPLPGKQDPPRRCGGSQLFGGCRFGQRAMNWCLCGLSKALCLFRHHKSCSSGMQNQSAFAGRRTGHQVAQKFRNTHARVWPSDQSCTVSCGWISDFERLSTICVEYCDQIQLGNHLRVYQLAGGRPMLVETAKLKRRYKSLIPLVDQILAVRDNAQSVQMESIFEPISIVGGPIDGPRRVHGLSGVDLTAWVLHTSHGTRVRMSTLEDAIVTELLHRRGLTALILCRAHMESAGLAAYALQTLTNSVRKGEIDQLELVIPKILFGSSLWKDREAQAIQENLEHSAQRPVEVTKLIKALDTFGEKTEWFTVNYALLSEYAHPNIRSTKEFSEVQATLDEGWIIQYGDKERFSSTLVRMALQIMKHSMHVGYAAALLLSSWKFEDTPTGISCSPPPAEPTARWIWDKIICGPPAEDEEQPGT